jgi:hypothetical protein
MKHGVETRSKDQFTKNIGDAVVPRRDPTEGGANQGEKLWGAGEDFHAPGGYHPSLRQRI